MKTVRIDHLTPVELQRASEVIQERLNRIDKPMIQIKMTPEYLAKNFTVTFKPAFNQEQIEKWLIEQVNMVCHEKNRDIEKLTQEKNELSKKCQGHDGFQHLLREKFLDAGIGDPDMDLLDLVNEAIERKKAETVLPPSIDVNNFDMVMAMQNLLSGHKWLIKEVQALKKSIEGQ